MSRWWDKPVRLRLNGKIVVVPRIRKAGLTLLNDWPAKRGHAYMIALEAVLLAIEEPDNCEAQAAARIIFEAAARDARILVEC